MLVYDKARAEIVDAETGAVLEDRMIEHDWNEAATDWRGG